MVQGRDVYSGPSWRALAPIGRDCIRDAPALTWMGLRPLLMAERLGEQN
jgi:hypothetical protein